MKLIFASAVAVSALGLVACATVPAVADQGSQASASDGRSSDLAAFPAAVAGQTRHVIQLPAQSDEDALKVQVIVGRTLRIDCNSHRFGGRLEERTAEGWGYTYFVLDSLGAAASTRMGCPAGSEREAFVTSPDQDLIRYNSRLPLVVYAPDDVEVRYRVWRAGAEQRTN